MSVTKSSCEEKGAGSLQPRKMLPRRGGMRHGQPRVISRPSSALFCTVFCLLTSLPGEQRGPLYLCPGELASSPGSGPQPHFSSLPFLQPLLPHLLYPTPRRCSSTGRHQRVPESPQLKAARKTQRRPHSQAPASTRPPTLVSQEPN